MTELHRHDPQQCFRHRYDVDADGFKGEIVWNKSMPD
jgi:hypothetical protein